MAPSRINIESDLDHTKAVEEKMRRVSKQSVPEKSISPTVTIRVSGRLSEDHLTYLDQFVSSAVDCGLWPLLDVFCLQELDHGALAYLVNGEGRNFGIVACPNFVREWMQHEKELQAA